MNTGEYLAQLAQDGIRIVWEGQSLAIEGDCSDDMANEIRQHKPEIMAWLAGERPLTDDEKADIARVFSEFRDAHGRALVPMGWNRDLVFGGLDPLAGSKVDDIPGIMAVLRSGGRIEVITPKWIKLRDQFDWPMAWLKSGCFVGGDLLQQLESEEKKRG